MKPMHQYENYYCENGLQDAECHARVLVHQLHCFLCGLFSLLTNVSYNEHCDSAERVQDACSQYV